MRPILLACLLLAACATEQPMPREKQGATEPEFMQARDACMKESTVPYTEGALSAYPTAPSGSAQEAISCPMYDKCMIGRGFQRTASGRFYYPILCRD